MKLSASHGSAVSKNAVPPKQLPLMTAGTQEPRDAASSHCIRNSGLTSGAAGFLSSPFPTCITSPTTHYAGTGQILQHGWLARGPAVDGWTARGARRRRVAATDSGGLDPVAGLAFLVAVALVT